MTVGHMPWILFLDPSTKCAHSVRIRTDTTLDQDCVPKATVQVCTACMIVSLLTTCEFQHEFSKMMEPRENGKSHLNGDPKLLVWLLRPLITVGVVVRGFPPLGGSSRQSDY